MKLRSDIDLVNFLKTASVCKGEVIFKSVDGDVLNLKSCLSRYILFAALSTESVTVFPEGEIICKEQEDYQKLQLYLL
ncbi:MAG: hypothetical protein LIO99_04130 [Clostridiales bacterium]|nr:hypothetical protein [Clostridiales bacterium]